MYLLRLQFGYLSYIPEIPVRGEDIEDMIKREARRDGFSQYQALLGETAVAIVLS